MNVTKPPPVTVSTGSLYSHGLERAMRTIHEAGFTAVELMTRDIGKEGYADTWDPKYLEEIASQYEISYHSIHAPFGIEDGQQGMYWARLYALATQLGAKDIILHIPRENQNEYKLWFDQFFAQEWVYEGPRILVENMGKKALYTGVKSFEKFPNFCYDICHAEQSRSNLSEDLAELMNIRQFHISSYSRDGDKTHLGILDNKESISTLLAMVPEATRCLEISPNAFAPNLMDTTSVIKMLTESREFLESI